MYVKSLRLAGFKSFADPTVLEFERGVNVIVGPNGSGKSNIADALAWVLGSQAPSSLRGASMEDVIFAGSAKRPRLGIAEVALTLDNSNRALPLDLAEVTISRSADRSGASEYRINGAACRLLDVMELLSDTGMGRSLHTVVGQGQLDAVLQSRPEDRRAFIEEAAQIGKYRRRKDRSLRKLERVEDNLMRLNDVVVELARALRPLKRQAKAASAHSELMAEFTELRQRVTATDLHRLHRDETVLDVAGEDQRARLLAEELSHIRAMLDGAGREREELVAAAEAAQTLAHGIARAADRHSSLARLARERSALIGSRLAAETEEGYRERIRLLEDERIRWEKESQSLSAIAAVARQKAEATRDRNATARAVLEAAEHAISDARRRETDAAQSLVRAEGAETAGRATLKSLETRVQAVEERRTMIERSIQTAADATAAAERDVATLEEELDGVTEKAADAETRLEEARDRADSLRERLGATHATCAAAQSRVDTLEEVLRELVGFFEAIARVEPLLFDARTQAAVATAGENEAKAILTQANDAVEARWREVARLDEELRRLDALMAGAGERVAASRREREAREIERSALGEELARVRDALAMAERATIEERAALPERRATFEQAQSGRVDAERKLVDARSELDAATRSLGDAEIEARAVEERALAAQLRHEEAIAGIADAQAALTGLEDRRSELRAAQVRVERVAELASYAATLGASWAEGADERAVAAREAFHEADRRLASMRERERELDERLEEVTRRRSEAEVRRAEMRARSEAVGERAMDEWGLDVQALLALEPFEAEAEVIARARVEQLEREMRRLGPVNPHAAQEYAELAERETFLNEQIEDLKSSRRDLMKIVREVDETIVEVFETAFEAVAREFEIVFDRLFPGGDGKLKLTDPGNLLETGIEVEARPPGKNVRKLSLLSGGERSLVALAFLFAIFRSRPSPFYLLDEVEAALDDVNLSRFLRLIEELEQHAQVLVVTHQKRTMEAADVLYGVTMAGDGVSKVVAKRMQEITL